MVVVVAAVVGEAVVVEAVVVEAVGAVPAILRMWMPRIETPLSDQPAMACRALSGRPASSHMQSTSRMTAASLGGGCHRHRAAERGTSTGPRSSLARSASDPLMSSFPRG